MIIGPIRENATRLSFNRDAQYFVLCGGTNGIGPPNLLAINFFTQSQVLTCGKGELLFAGGRDIECYHDGVSGFRSSVAHAQPKEAFGYRNLGFA